MCLILEVQHLQLHCCCFQMSSEARWRVKTRSSNWGVGLTLASQFTQLASGVPSTRVSRALSLPASLRRVSTLLYDELGCGLASRLICVRCRGRVLVGVVERGVNLYKKMRSIFPRLPQSLSNQCATLEMDTLKCIN